MVWIDGREELILPFIKNKVVLDLGVEETSERDFSTFIYNNAESYVGVEINEKRAEYTREKGRVIVTGDVEQVRLLGEKFDVVVAGDILEHLSNPGLALQNVAYHLKDDGYFLASVPNAYSINFLLRGLFRGGRVKHFYEHTNVYNEGLLQELYSRNGFVIKRIVYYTHKDNNPGNLVIRFFGFFQKRWRDGIFVVAQKKINGNVTKEDEELARCLIGEYSDYK